MNSRHQNIIDYKERFKSKDCKINYLVSELAPLGDLFEVLQRINHQGQRVWLPLRPKYCRHFIKGIALGVQHLFSLGVSHGDIPEPIISEQFRCSPVTAAPESLYFEKCYDMKIADVYSVGACLSAMLLACYPFIPSNDTPEEELKIRSTLLKSDTNLLNKLIERFEPTLKEALLRILEPKPQNRITIEEFLEEVWINNQIESVNF